MIDLDASFEKLLGVTQALAVAFSEQESLFPSFVVVADELALNFSDSYLMVEQLARAGFLSKAQTAALKLVERELQAMTEAGRPELWTLDALRGAKEWESVRSRAAAALRALSVKPERPNLAGISYVKGHS